MTTKNQDELFGTASIRRILLKTAPPVMLAQLIQALYNIVDSFFVGKYSTDALTALTVIYPLQLIIIALAVGTGVGTNTYMARKYALNQPQKADAAAGTGMVLAVVMWAVLAIVSVFIMRPYVKTSASSPAAIDAAVTYGIIVSVGSLGSFLEGNWTKVRFLLYKKPILCGFKRLQMPENDCCGRFCGRFFYMLSMASRRSSMLSRCVYLSVTSVLLCPKIADTIANGTPALCMLVL